MSEYQDAYNEYSKQLDLAYQILDITSKETLFNALGVFAMQLVYLAKNTVRKICLTWKKLYSVQTLIR